MKKNDHFAVFRTIEAAGCDWDAAAPRQDFFLQRPYLAILEANPPKGMRFAYLVFYKADKPVGVAVCQIQHFNAGENIQKPAETAAKRCFFTSLGAWFKRWVAVKASAELLVAGNLLLSGEHGYYFDPEAVGAQEIPSMLEDGWQEVVRLMESEKLKVPVILLKDVHTQRQAIAQELVPKGFIEFEIQPCMQMALPFENFDAYLAAMSTKYRTRAKRAFKKAAGIEKKELHLPEIQEEGAAIYHLYAAIAHNAGFNMVNLNPDYLTALKRELGPQFRMFAYYEQEKLIAFYTIIRNGDEIEAHFLGYDRELNHDRQLYLNILYDIVRLAIESGAHSINFARTALEIKSSVGAEPLPLYCYLRHENPLKNRVTGRLLDYLNPVEVWRQRHPFKSGGEHED
jgi:predicted N-acyltransferase